MDNDNFNKTLQAYHKAIEEEFSLAQAENLSSQLTQNELAQKAKELLIRRAPMAAATLEYLAQYAELDSVRLKAATYILDNALAKDPIADKDKDKDPLDELVNKLTKSTSEI